MRHGEKELWEKVSKFLGGTANGLHTEALALKKEVDDHLAMWGDSFTITSICKEDLARRGYDLDKVTDLQMERLASKMADDYITQLFWDQLPIIAEGLSFPEYPEFVEYSFIRLTVEEAVNERMDNDKEIYAYEEDGETEFLIELDKEEESEDVMEYTKNFRNKCKELVEKGYILIKESV